jgi:hypothetical protein
MNIGPRVLEVMQHYGISKDELEQMVQRAAITSQEGGNRKFHTWIFNVHDGAVVSMRPVEKTVVGKDKGNGVQHEDCDKCDGFGCKDCGWWGHIIRYI